MVLLDRFQLLALGPDRGIPFRRRRDRVEGSAV
jgi:hypothetical protein